MSARMTSSFLILTQKRVKTLKRLVDLSETLKVECLLNLSLAGISLRRKLLQRHPQLSILTRLETA